MSFDRRSFLIAGGAAVAATLTAESARADANGDAAKFIADHERTVKPLEVQAGIAWWNANISGKDDDFKKKEDAQNAIDAALSNPEAFAEMRQQRFLPFSQHVDGERRLRSARPR